MDDIVVSPLVMGMLYEMAIASFVTFLSEGFCQKVSLLRESLVPCH
jgi:hypothetical protein